MTIERLQANDEGVATLTLLARDDADFDLAGRSEPLTPLTHEHALAHLSNSAVLHWVAREGDVITGLLYCIHLPLRSGDGHELLLYEIGVRSAYRRRGIARALLAAMDEWMKEHGVNDVWVGADNRGAIDFYRACGFVAEDTDESDIDGHGGLGVHVEVALTASGPPLAELRGRRLVTNHAQARNRVGCSRVDRDDTSLLQEAAQKAALLHHRQRRARQQEVRRLPRQPKRQRAHGARPRGRCQPLPARRQRAR